jgi:hypothetical protein
MHGYLPLLVHSTEELAYCYVYTPDPVVGVPAPRFPNSTLQVNTKTWHSKDFSSAVGSKSRYPLLRGNHRLLPLTK